MIEELLGCWPSPVPATLFGVMQTSLPESMISFVDPQGRAALAQTCRTARDAVDGWRKREMRKLFLEDGLKTLLPYFCTQELRKRHLWTFEALQRELVEEVLPAIFKSLEKASLRSLAKAAHLSIAKLKLISPKKVFANPFLLRCVLQTAYNQSLIAITSLAMDGPSMGESSSLTLEKKAEFARRYLLENPNLTSLVYPRSWERPRVTCLPKEIFALRKLQDLILGGQKIRILPPSIGNLSRLRVLELDDNCLVSVSGRIKKLSALRTINFNRNGLSSLPNGLGSLSRLRFLEVEDNLLTKIPITVKKLKVLRDLCLSGNRLSSLPSGIGSLPRLSCLRLGHNRLSSIPKTFQRLRSLRVIELHGNSLPRVPAYLRKLSGLKIDA